MSTQQQGVQTSQNNEWAWVMLGLLPVIGALVGWLNAGFQRSRPGTWETHWRQHGIRITISAGVTLAWFLVASLMPSPLRLTMFGVAWLIAQVPFYFAGFALRVWHLDWQLRTRAINPLDEPGVMRAQKHAATRRARTRVHHVPLTVAEVVENTNGRASPKVRPVLGVEIRESDAWATRLERSTRPEVDRLTSWGAAGSLVALPGPHEPVHMVALGGTGTGKTVTTLRLAQGYAVGFGYRVIYIDAKGSESDQVDFYEAMTATGGTVALWPQQPFDLWRGATEEVYDRLLGPQIWTEPHYRSLAEVALQVIVRDSPQGPPRSARELIQRIANPMSYASAEGKLALSSVTDGRNSAWPGIAARYFAWAGNMRSLLEPDGLDLNTRWGWEDYDHAYIRLDSKVQAEAIIALGGAMIRDFDTYSHLGGPRRRRNGRPDDRPILFILDEYGVLAETVPRVVEMLERSRCHRVTVLLSGQSFESLGPLGDRLLNAGVTLLIHGSDAPEQMLARAGTRRAVEVGHSLVNGRSDVGQSARAQDQYLIPPQMVRQLEQGQLYVVRRGHSIKVQAALPVGREQITGVPMTTIGEARRMLTTATEVPKRDDAPPAAPTSTRPMIVVDDDKVRAAMQVLGLHVGAGSERITAAYRDAVRLCHPDTGADIHPKRFLDVQTAYETLRAAGRV